VVNAQLFLESDHVLDRHIEAIAAKGLALDGFKLLARCIVFVRLTMSSRAGNCTVSSGVS
jgi:hypothetical protein